MTDDKEIDLKISDALNKLETPTIDESVKQQSIKLAMAEYQTVQQKKTERRKILQGIWQIFRPNHDTRSHDRRKAMQYNNRLLTVGMPAACAGLLAVVIFTLVDDTSLSHITDTDKRAQMIPVENIDGHIPNEHVPKVESSELASNNRFNRRLLEKEQASVKPQAPPRKAAQKNPAKLADEILSLVPAPPESLSTDPSAGLLTPKASYNEQRIRKPDGKATLDKAIGIAATTSTIEKRNSSSFHRGYFSFPDTDNIITPNPYKDTGRDRFENFKINTVKKVSEQPVSTFSIDVDTASYSFVRRQLNRGLLPQKDAVRVEEMINYFDYAYPLPKNKREPFKPSIAITDSPWAKERKLLHIAIKGYEIEPAKKPRTNLVFLLDVSGSMNSPDKLPLVRQSMELLLTSLDPEDTVAIVTYAGAAGTALNPTKVKEKLKITSALNNLHAGGSTAGAAGIRLAYQLAEASYVKKGINRIILATDGDFNVGITNRDELKGFVERKRDKGIFLSVLGFGEGNYYDHMMQTLAQNGNGVATYIDTLSEAQKVLVDEATSSLFSIAKDVKIQIEFNPKTVAEYRLIGYETRHLNREDFNNDAVDAGDIGAGHTVTALYEITPIGAKTKQIDESRYTKKPATKSVDKNIQNEYGFLKMRYKLPNENKSNLISTAIGKEDEISTMGAKRQPWMQQETGFATAVAAFAQILRGSKYTGEFDYDDVIKLAQSTKGNDEYGYRTEFIQLVRKAKSAKAMGK